VLIRPAELDAIRRGEIDLAFRRWDRPRLLPGTKMRTKIGLVEITAVDRVAASAITTSDARRAGSPSKAALLALMEPRGDRPKNPIWRVGLRYAGEDPRIALRASADLSPDDRVALNARLDRLDASSRHGAWTRDVLALIAANPARRAPDLAELRGLETVVFKRDVRKLKELGLTESLDVGYRISPRGEALLDG
jgi:hypothetical protein